MGLLLNMCICLVITHVIFAITLVQLSKTRYTLLWDGYYGSNETCNHNPHLKNDFYVDIPRHIRFEDHCHKNSDAFLNKPHFHEISHGTHGSGLSDIQQMIFKQSGHHPINICIIITTAPRKGIDYFNITLSSLLYAYKHAQYHTQNNIHYMFNIFESSDSNNFSYKQAVVKQLQSKISNIQYHTNTLKELKNATSRTQKWSRKVIKHSLDALNHCSSTRYALMLQDDILIGDDFFQHLEIIFTQLLPQQNSNERWFYLKIFHTEFWEGWGLTASHVMYLSLIFIASITVIHLSLYRQSPPRKHKWILILIYIWFGGSCTSFVHSIGKQNIDYYVHRLLWYQQLIPLKSSAQTAMAQANIYDLQYLSELNQFYESYVLPKQGGWDVFTGSFSTNHNLEIWTYFPSLVQHIGRASSSKEKRKYKCKVRGLKQSMTFIGSTFCS
eukprot:61895_1